MDRYGLIGRPLGHSRSQKWMNDIFKRLGLDARYDNYELADIGDLLALLAQNPHIKGLNVTSPFKEAVLPFLDDMDSSVRRAQAANVLSIERSKGQIKIYGSNTDIIGFKGSLRGWLPPHCHGQAMIFGTGGASRAVQIALEDFAIPYITVSRYPQRADITYAQLTGTDIAKHRLLINATPLGMGEMEGLCPPLPYDAIGAQHYCYDLIYNPAETEFLRRCRLQGAMTHNGLEMLLGQARATLQIWLPGLRL